MQAETKTLPRATIGEFISSPRGVRAFESLQGDTEKLYAAVDQAQFLTLTSDANLSSARRFTPAEEDLSGEDGGAGGDYILRLAATTVAAGGYGDASHMVKVTFDAKGRATDAESFELNSDNVAEGVTNLFFTNARAREALSAGEGIDYDASSGEIALDPASTRNTDHALVEVQAGPGLTGGGDITETRTIALEEVGAAGTYGSPTSITVDQYGRVTAIS